jgi:hypothetical protein
MALFIRDQVAQMYAVRKAVGKGKDGAQQERHYVDLGFLSNSKNQSGEFVQDEPLYISALVKGKEALSVLQKAEPKSLHTLTLKGSSYTVEKDGKRESRVLWQVLVAAPFVPKGKKDAPEPSFAPTEELSDDIPF